MSERTCLIDRLKNGELNVAETVNTTYSLISELGRDVEGYFLESPFCVVARNFEGAINKILNNEELNVNLYLDYCELVLTVLVPYEYSKERYYKKAEHIIKILSNGLNKIAWEVTYNDEKKCVVCCRKDLKAEAVALNKPKQVKDKIYEYLSLREGDKDGKRQVLKSLIDEIDTYCKTKSSSNSSIKKAKHFYQCVRHPIDDPVKEFPFYYKNEESWLDCIFQMVLDILSIQDLEKRVEIVTNAENSSKE